MENNQQFAQSTPQDWFPYTKFQLPQPGANLVSRSRLQTSLIDAVHHHKLTLVAAPAGSGKTILSSTLAQSGFATAWAALDSSDDDFPIFVALLVVALQNQLQNEGQAVLSFLQTVPNIAEKAPQLASILINNLVSVN